MAKTRQKTRQHNLDSVMDFGDDELQSTLHEFMVDEKKENTNIWNFATIAGIAMFFVGMVYTIQSLLLGGSGLAGVIEVMSIFGGFLVAFVGFGFFVGDRKKKRQEKKRRKRRQSRKFDFDFESDEYEDYTLNNDLGSSKKSKSKSSAAYDFDPYALGQSKKLYKSRTDKKWAGVCGGLAKYFGISSTVIRLLFVITFFAGSGASLLVYIALAVALDKEPPEMMDDFDY
ncbi:MAG TPA: PspC domain-containing protein [Balneolaceae bacterium]